MTHEGVALLARRRARSVRAGEPFAQAASGTHALSFNALSYVAALGSLGPASLCDAATEGVGAEAVEHASKTLLTLSSSSMLPEHKLFSNAASTSLYC